MRVLTSELCEQGAKVDNRKNKAGEKLAESEEDLLAHRTDDTDAFDTLQLAVKSFLSTIPFRYLQA